MQTTIYPPILLDKTFFIIEANKSIRQGLKELHSWFSKYFGSWELEEKPEDKVRELYDLLVGNNIYTKEEFEEQFGIDIDNTESVANPTRQKLFIKLSQLVTQSLSIPQVQITFKHNPAYNSNYDGIIFQIYSTTGILVETKKIPKNEIKDMTFKATLEKQYYYGSYYKYQLSYYFNNAPQYRIVKSEIGLLKPIEMPITQIENLETDELQGLPSNTLIGYYNNGGDYSEPPVKYSFEIRRKRDNLLIETSGELLHDASLDEGKDYYDQWRIGTELADGEIYIVQYKVISLNGYEGISPAYSFIMANTLKPDLYDAELLVKNKFEEGCVDISLQPTKGNNLLTGHFEILRAAEDENWQLILRLDLNNTDVNNCIWKDYTVEQGREYTYAIRQYTDIFTTDMVKSKKVKVDFEDIFLYDGERSLRIRFNPQVSSFKNVIQEQKQETIGGKYPIIFRNGSVKYKEFPIGGLISFREENYKNFLTLEELHLVEEEELTTANRITAERMFKLQVQDWLNNGKPKMFRSPEEGNYLVYLSQVSLTPFDGTQREVHNFSATAYEIAEFNYDNLIKFNFLSGENIRIEESLNKITSINIKDKIEVNGGFGFCLLPSGLWNSAATLVSGNISSSLVWQNNINILKVSPSTLKNNYISIDLQGSWIYPYYNPEAPNDEKFWDSSPLLSFLSKEEVNKVQLFYESETSDSAYLRVTLYYENWNKESGKYSADYQVKNIGDLQFDFFDNNNKLQQIHISFLDKFELNIKGISFTKEKINSIEETYYNFFSNKIKDWKASGCAIKCSQFLQESAASTTDYAFLFDEQMEPDVGYDILYIIYYEEMDKRLINPQKAITAQFQSFSPGTQLLLGSSPYYWQSTIRIPYEIGTMGTLFLSQDALAETGYIYIDNSESVEDLDGVIYYVYKGGEDRPDNEKYVEYQYVLPQLAQSKTEFQYNNNSMVDILNEIKNTKDKSFVLGKFYYIHLHKKEIYKVEGNKLANAIADIKGCDFPLSMAYVYYGCINVENDSWGYALYDGEHLSSISVANAQENLFQYSINNSELMELKDDCYIVNTPSAIDSFSVGYGIIAEYIYDGVIVKRGENNG